MKHGRLHAVSHNFADSLASGVSLIIGHYSLDIFAVAAANSDHSVLVDFLKGTVESEVPDSDLEIAIPLFKNALPEFCERHGIDVSDFRAFVVRYTATLTGNAYIVTIEDRGGERSSREYAGAPGRRTEVLDHLGRRRPKQFREPMD